MKALLYKTYTVITSLLVGHCYAAMWCSMQDNADFWWINTIDYGWSSKVDEFDTVQDLSVWSCSTVACEWFASTAATIYSIVALPVIGLLIFSCPNSRKQWFVQVEEG